MCSCRLIIPVCTLSCLSLSIGTVKCHLVCIYSKQWLEQYEKDFHSSNKENPYITTYTPHDKYSNNDGGSYKTAYGKVETQTENQTAQQHNKRNTTSLLQGASHLLTENSVETTTILNATSHNTYLSTRNLQTVYNRNINTPIGITKKGLQKEMKPYT